MSLSEPSSLTWLQRTLRWSNSRESWQERAGLLLVLVLAVFAFLVGRKLTLSYQVVVWGLVLVATAIVLRRGWLKLFGPVLFYDLVRVARRLRYFMIRSIYGFALLLLLSWTWFMWYMETRFGGFSANDMAMFASSFFYMFMSIQFLVVVILTPAYTAGAISDEKERKTLEFLLATDLRNREIVLSKLVSRLANLILLTLVGLPILSFLQFLGGVDPALVLAGFAATFLTVISLACLSICFSVLVRKTRDAIALTYLTALAYLLLSGGSLLLLLLPGVSEFPSTYNWTSPITVEDVLNGLNVGNIVFVIVHLGIDVDSGLPLDESLPSALRNYALFHGAVALICATWAVLRLRTVHLKETYGKPQKAARGVRSWLRPGVSEQPMLWKEVFAESRMHFHWIGRIFIILLVIASFVPAGVIVAQFVDRWWYSAPYYGWSRASQDIWRYFGEEMNVYVRIVGTIVALLLLLGVAVRAAGSISSERDRQTWDSLMTSPLDSNTILFAKWLGSILSVRWGWLWLGGIGLLGLASTGVHPLAAPLLLAAWFIYAAFLAALGTWFSTVSRSTLRATLWTLVTAIGVAFGHWLIWACCIPLLWVGQGPGSRGMEDLLEWVAKFQAFGLTPPATLGFLAFHGREFNYHRYGGGNEAIEMLICAVIGLGVYAGATAFLWGATSARLRLLTNRTPHVYPEFAAVREGQTPWDSNPRIERKPRLISEEASSEYVQPIDEPPPRPRGAILIDEEWRDDP